jgi:hypothetical protein
MSPGGGKGAAAQHRVPQPIVEGCDASARQVELAGVAAALVARHLRQQLTPT